MSSIFVPRLSGVKPSLSQYPIAICDDIRRLKMTEEELTPGYTLASHQLRNGVRLVKKWGKFLGEACDALERPVKDIIQASEVFKQKYHQQVNEADLMTDHYAVTFEACTIMVTLAQDLATLASTIRTELVAPVVE